MDVEKFAVTLLEELEKAELPVVEMERIKKGLFQIKISDGSKVLIRIGGHESEQEATFPNVRDENNRIHEIYKRFINSWEYNQVLMHNDFDIEWLKRELNIEDYRRLEDYFLYYCSKNDELLFKLGFQYAWSLFHECSTKEKFGENDK